MPVLLLATYAASSGATAQSVTESDEARFLRLTQQLEERPLGDADKSVRSWLIQWAMDSKDVSVVACDILGTLEDDDANNGIYTTQMIFGNAAYQISHPDNRKDLLATQLAGARSALRAYSSILAAHPEARNQHLDELVAQDEAGTLERRLEPVVADKCNNSGGA